MLQIVKQSNISIYLDTRALSCRLKEDRKMKAPMFATITDSNKKGRPHKERCDDTKCGSSFQDRSHRAMNREEKQQTVEMASYVNGQ